MTARDESWGSLVPRSIDSRLITGVGLAVSKNTSSAWFDPLVVSADRVDKGQSSGEWRQIVDGTASSCRSRRTGRDLRDDRIAGAIVETHARNWFCDTLSRRGEIERVAEGRGILDVAQSVGRRNDQPCAIGCYGRDVAVMSLSTIATHRPSTATVEVIPLSCWPVPSTSDGRDLRAVILRTSSVADLWIERRDKRRPRGRAGRFENVTGVIESMPASCVGSSKPAQDGVPVGVPALSVPNAGVTVIEAWGDARIRSLRSLAVSMMLYAPG